MLYIECGMGARSSFGRTSNTPQQPAYTRVLYIFQHNNYKSLAEFEL